VPPDTLPTDTRELLNMMDEAFRVAIMGEPGSRAWERAKLLFDLLHSHFSSEAPQILAKRMMA
jgi:hypothetical protein